MQVINWNESNLDFLSSQTGISIGSFDGLHKGHRVLLNSLVQNCKKNNLKSGIVTFYRPLPSIKHSSDYAGDISTLKQRLELFENVGIDFVILVDFDNDFAQLKGIEFLSLLVKKYNMCFLAEGVDFRCGYKGATDSTAIQFWAKQNKIDCIFVEPVYFKDERISSSYIRQMIQKGFFSTITELLARPYELDIETMVKDGKLTQVLPPDGKYSVKDEKNELQRIKILNGMLTDFPPVKKVFF